MPRLACLLAAVFTIGSFVPAWPQDNSPRLPKKLPDGVYAVQRESLKESDILPLKAEELLLVHRHRYLKKDKIEPPRFLVVRPSPDVTLDLADRPKAVKEGDEVVRVYLKLKPGAARALERLTGDSLGKEIAIVLGGEVVTTHKIRSVIKGGDVQITNCAPGAANYLLEQLQRHYKSK